MMRTFHQNIAVDVLAGNIANATTNVTTAVMDMQGYESGALILTFEDSASGATAQLQLQHSDLAASGFAQADDSAGDDAETPVITAAAADDFNDKCMIISFTNPTKRYIRASIIRGAANSHIAAVIGVKFNASHVPVLQPDLADPDATFVANGLH